jgi:hypothetical protein
LVQAALMGLNILTGYFSDLKQMLSKHKNRIFLFHLSLFLRTTERGMCQTPDLSIFVKKKIKPFTLSPSAFLWGLVMKAQCANPNMKSMLHNKPRPVQPLQKGRLQECFRTEVLDILLHFLPVHGGAEWWVLILESTSQNVHVSENICAQLRRNYIPGKFQKA